MGYFSRLVIGSNFSAYYLLSTTSSPFFHFSNGIEEKPPLPPTQSLQPQYSDHGHTVQLHLSLFALKKAYV